MSKFLNSLSKKVDKEIKTTLYKNSTYLDSRWGAIENSIIRWSTYYVRYAALLFILAVLISVNLVLWKSLFGFHVVSLIPNWIMFAEWQGVFLTGQLTIVGLVYPIVISLISILIQNKSAKNIIFPIYQTYSGFMFAGLSGLGLSVFILIGYFARGVTDNSFYVAICITSALWILLNLILTIWFFITTSKFLDEESSKNIIFRFSINQVCEKDIRNRIRNILIDFPVRHKIITTPDENILKVKDFDYSDRDYQDIYCGVNRDKSIKEIRFWLINIAIKIQFFSLKKKNIKGGELLFQINRTKTKSDRITVARFAGFEPTKIVKFLIKLAYVFDEKPFKSELGLSLVLKAFMGSADDALKDGSTSEFSDALDRIISWHVEISKALLFKDETGQLDSWLHLPSSVYWGRSYFQELMSEYYRLGRETVECIPRNSKFYSDMLRLHKRIYFSSENLLDLEIRELIQGNYFLWYALVEWGSYNSDSEEPRVRDKYQDSLYSFVSAWESWLVAINSELSVSSQTTIETRALLDHIEYTASTSISALRFNNIEAAGLGVDLLILWLEGLTFNEYWEQKFRWRSVLINPLILELSSDNPIWNLILRTTDYDYKAACALAYENVHLDLRLLTACYVLLKPNRDDKEILGDFVKKLILGSPIYSSSTLTRSIGKIENVGDLVGCYIRQRDYRPHQEESYGSWLSSIMRSFGRMYKEKRITGRLYSGWSYDAPQSMHEAFVEIGIFLSKSESHLPFTWEEAILSDAFRYKDKQLIILDLQDWIEIAKKSQGNSLISNDNDFGKQKSNFINSIETIIRQLVSEQGRTLSQASIDQEQLNALGEASSFIMRDISHPKFPLSLFDELCHVDRLDQQLYMEFGINNYDKALVAEEIDADKPINQDQTLARLVSDHVKFNILLRLTERKVDESYRLDNIEMLIAKTFELSKLLIRPILFVADNQILNVFRRSLFDKNLADHYNISHREGYDNEYVCHIGNCEVYNLSGSKINYNLLTSRELFGRIEFQKITDTRFVDVRYKLHSGHTSDSKGKLLLSYYMDVQFADNVPLFKFELISADENNH